MPYRTCSNPLCSPEERARADRFDPLQVFQASEAVTTLMRRHVRRAKNFVRVTWRREGAMRVGDRLLPRDALALEGGAVLPTPVCL